MKAKNIMTRRDSDMSAAVLIYHQERDDQAQQHDERTRHTACFMDLQPPALLPLKSGDADTGGHKQESRAHGAGVKIEKRH
jgi:hypothetical protein